jgi:LysR family transcriptional regulator, low CO2-responsive transcriptional regulator
MSVTEHEFPPGRVGVLSPVRVPARYDNRITLQKLEVFCCIVELGGVSRAADHLWVAQSVVSGHLRSLQERLGVQVLYRDGQRMKLTKAGEQVYRWASETLSGTRELMRQLDDLDGTDVGTLAVATSLTVGSYLMPPILAEFRRDRPGAVITMSVSDPEPAFAAVGSGECDVGIVIDETDHEHPHLRCEEIGREKIVLVGAADSLPGVDAVSLADLSGIVVVAPPAGNLAREAVDRLLVELGLPPQNVVMELGHPEAMKRVIRSGVASGLLFRSCVEDELAAGILREIRLSDADLSLPVVSVTRADRRPSFIQTQLVGQTRAHLAAR